MSCSNLPPEMTDSMIPGNHPEDREWENSVYELLSQCVDKSLSASEIKTLSDVGLAAVMVFRKHHQEHLKYYINDAYKILLPLVAGMQGRLIDRVLNDLRETGFVEDTK